MNITISGARKHAKRSLTFVAVAAIVIGTVPMNTAHATTRGISVGVPAYVWPGDPFLEDLTDPVKTPVPPSIVIVNVGNGQGDMSILDSTADAIRARVTAEDEHVKVIGYVDTAFTTRSLSTVEADVDGWLDTRNGSSHYDGIFFDQSTRTCGATTGSTTYRDYYRTLREYVWSKIPSTEELVVNNPGTAVEDCFLASGHRTADVYITFEGDITTYNQTPGPGNGYVGYAGGNVFNATTGYRTGTDFDSDSFWHLVYNVGSTQANTTVAQAYDRYAGYVDVTDDYYTGAYINPWDAKPTYLNSAITYVASLPL